jgi:predicted permease
MKPGVALADAQEEIASIGRQVGREYSEYGADGATFYGVGLQDDATREVRPALLALFGAVFLLLTIGCVNVAGLLVSRAAARQHEIAVRMAIGAGRVRLFRQQLVEALIFSVAGGAAGLLVARELLALLIAMRPPSLSRLDVTRIDLDVFTFAAAVALLWGVVFSLAPLAQIFRTNVSGVLQGLKSGPIVGFGQRVRSALVVVQVAVSAVLLVTSVLLAKGFYELQKVRAGFDESGVLTFKVSLNGSRHRGVEAAAAFSRQLRERLAAIPGVSAAGAISHLPYDTVPNWGTPYLREHESDTRLAGVADARAVTPGYFAATGAELVEGRWFTEADSSRAQPVAIVDTLLASRMWPGRSPIGQRVKADPGTTGIPDVTVTVVGVVRHIRHRDVTRDLREQMYFPAQQSFRNPMAYVVRGADGDGASVAAAVRRIMAEIDPALPIYDVRPLAAYTRDARALRAFTLVLALCFAGAAIVLATIGMFGVASHAVAGRQREFGLRFALGAGSGQIAGLVFREAMAIAGWGAALGSMGALLAAPLLRSQLYAVSPLDPRAYALGAALVVIAAVTASCIPALRAARTSPLQSLRVD